MTSIVGPDDFGPFEDNVWLNTAHQGALPRVAFEAAEDMIARKRSPYRIAPNDFDVVPRRLREALARLIDVDATDVILGNATSYGMNLLVQGLAWEPGDEIILVRGDFPATVVVWMPLRERGVEIRFLEPRRGQVTVEDLAAAMTSRTKVLCSSWVFSFFGSVIDVEAVGALCRERGITFVLNAAQGLGARPFSARSTPVDAVVGCGFKWLCGPYGTGFCYMRPELRSTLRYRQAYWLAQHNTGEELSERGVYRWRDDGRAEAFDLFGTANFFNFAPLTASLELLLDKGIERVALHDQALVQRLLDGLDRERYEVISPEDGSTRSTLVVFSERDAARNRSRHEALGAANVYAAMRNGNLRISPHLYNSEKDIDRALEVLAKP